jgi:cell wall-associated NlpC family hydrolase
MTMLVGDFLDGGGRGISQALAGAGVIVFVLLGIIALAPVLILAAIVPGLHLGGPSAAISATTASFSGVPIGGPSTLSPPTAPQGAAPPPPPPLGSTPVEVARRYLGIPYLFGGTDPRVGLDCSGLVQLVYRQVGVNLPRTAQQQYDATPHISPADLQPGDLVFFARTYADPHDWVTHVGIYIGDGLQINAPDTGQRVSIQPVFTGFWGAHFTSGGRPHFAST